MNTKKGGSPMELNKKEFEILAYIERLNGEKLSQRRIATGAGC